MLEHGVAHGLGVGVAAEVLGAHARGEGLVDRGLDGHGLFLEAKAVPEEQGSA